MDNSQSSPKNTLKVIVAVAILIVAGTVLAVTMTGGGPPVTTASLQYFMDLGTGKLYAVDASLEPPLEPDSKHTDADGRPGGVRAYVYTCGACTEGEQFVGYLETYTPGTAQALAELQAKYPDVNLEDLPAGELQAYTNLEGGKLWASQDLAGGWQPSNTEKGRALRTAAMTKCGGAAPKPCFPTAK